MAFATSSKEGFTVGTYNLLYSSENFKNKIAELTPLHQRITILAANIISANLDVVCLQELFPSAAHYFTIELRKFGYSLIWKMHNKYHGIGILYKTYKFEVLKDKTSDVQFEVPDLKQPGKMFTKQRTYLRVDFIFKNKIITIVTGHFPDPRDFVDKAFHVKKVIELAEEQETYTVARRVIAGDMNQDQFGDHGLPVPDKPSEELATAFKPLIKNYSTDGSMDSSEVDYDEKIKNFVLKGRRVDWIWSDGEKKPSKCIFWQELAASDHIMQGSRVYF